MIPRNAPLRRRAGILGQEMRPLQHALRGPECQVQHWKEGGHDKLSIVKKAGGREYNCEKYWRPCGRGREMRRDTKGDVLHLHAGPPLERRRRASARVLVAGRRLRAVSCLAEQAKILGRRLGENLGLGCEEPRGLRGTRAACAGRLPRRRASSREACWKTYVGRHEDGRESGQAMNLLGLGLPTGHDEEALAP